MKTSLLLAALAVSLCACPGPATPPTTGTVTQGGGDGTGTTGDTTGGDPTTDPAPGLGQDCGADDACADGLTCVTYYGIAGASGPAFKSCEVPCADPKAVCPEGTSCVTIADGPGQVCR